jgi:hypothetical protein
MFDSKTWIWGIDRDTLRPYLGLDVSTLGECGGELSTVPGIKSFRMAIITWPVPSKLSV